MTKYRFKGTRAGEATLRTWVSVGKKQVPLVVPMYSEGRTREEFAEALDRLHRKQATIDAMFRRTASLPGGQE